MNIIIIRTFVRLREILSTQKEFGQKLKELELKFETHDEHIAAIFGSNKPVSSSANGKAPNGKSVFK